MGDASCFRMPIDAAFYIEGAGPVIAGTIENGNLSVEDYIEVTTSSGQSVVVQVSAIESFGKRIATARRGEQIGAHLEGQNLPADFAEECRGGVARKAGARSDHSSGAATEAASPAPEKIQGVFDALRDGDFDGALAKTALLGDSYPNDADCAFIEGAIAYALRADNRALNCFRRCMALTPVHAEALFYVGQMITESAIDLRQQSVQTTTAEEALKTTGPHYVEATLAFAAAERAAEVLNLQAISDHLGSYYLVLDWSQQTNDEAANQLASNASGALASAEEWLSILGIPHALDEATSITALCRYVDITPRADEAVFVVAPHDAVDPLSRRGQCFNLSHRDVERGLSHVSRHRPILTTSELPGFNQFESWLPTGTERLRVVLVNPNRMLAVELLGLLARLGLGPDKPPLELTLLRYEHRPRLP